MSYGELWWTMVDCGGLWWTVVDYGGLWWSVVDYGGLWQVCWTVSVSVSVVDSDCGGL